MKIVSWILILFLISFHYNPHVRFIKFEMVFKCWIEYRRCRWILMATSVMKIWTQKKKWLYLVCTFLQSIERASWRLATCHVQVDMMRRTGCSQWNRFGCIAQDESDVTLWWHVQMPYFHLLHNSFNGGIAYTEARRLLRTSWHAFACCTPVCLL